MWTSASRRSTRFCASRRNDDGERRGVRFLLCLRRGEPNPEADVYALSMELTLRSPAMNRVAEEVALDGGRLDRLRRRDPEAFGEVVDAYQARVFGFVRRMVPTGEDAEDVTQEVFLKAYRNIAGFDGRCTLRTWLFRIAHNLCIDRARRRGRTPETFALLAEDEPGGFDVPDSGATPEAILMTGELQELLERAIVEMSEKLRSVLLLHDREEMPYDEIAETLGIPVGTVKSRLFLARAHLQK
ncbi:sigma-70 family RNA polymerase sigma factor, partial [bacterium]